MDNTLKKTIQAAFFVLALTVLVWPSQAAFLDQTEITDITNHTIDRWSNESVNLTIRPYEGFTTMTCITWGDVGCAEYRITDNIKSITIETPLRVKSSVEGEDIIIAFLVAIFVLVFFILFILMAQYMKRSR